MCQMILRFQDTSSDVEVITQNNNEIVEKMISIKDCVELLKKEFDDKEKESFSFDNFDNRLLAFNRQNNIDYYLYKLDERKILCTYNEKVYSVTHPNTIFLMSVDNNMNKMQNVKAFVYNEYNGLDTTLYKYPFPNMLGGNSICTGTISREVSNPVDTFLNIIEGNYTHNHSETDYKGFTNTEDFFKKNSASFHYEICDKANMTLDNLRRSMNEYKK